MYRTASCPIPACAAVEVAPGVARVTFGRERRVTPQFIRARVELAGHFNVSGRRITAPRIVAQAQDGAKMTWEARLLRDDEPDTVL